MFWAIYNETSEGTIEDYAPSGVFCQSNGAGLTPIVRLSA